MTDQTIPADQARRARQWARDTLDDVENGANVSAYARDAARTLIAMMPRPTLADMTPDERAACQWMQADVKGAEITSGIIAKINPTDAHLIASDGETWFLAFDTVTPRPDLPRMEWPGDKKPAPAPALPDGWRLADHPQRGRVIVTNTTPNRNGHVYFTRAHDSDPRGFGWDYCTPDVLTFLDAEQEEDPSTAPDHLAVGTVIESADDPRIDALPVGSILLDCDGETAIKRSEAWTGDGYTPIEDEGGTFGPWTVLHIQKEADQ